MSAVTRRMAPLLLTFVLLVLPGLAACHEFETAAITHPLATARTDQQQAQVTNIRLRARAVQPLTLRTTIIRWAGWVTLLSAMGLTLMWIIWQNGKRRWLGVLLLSLFLIIGRFWLWPGF